MQSPIQSYDSLPKRSESLLQVSKGKVLCNYFPLQLTREIDQIYIFSIQMDPHLTNQRIALRQRIFAILEPQISKIINKPIILGMEIYSHSEPKAIQKTFESGDYQITIKFRRVIRMKDHANGLLIVLQRIMRSLMIKKNYNILAKAHKFFNMKRKVQHYSVNVFEGYHIDFVKSQSLFFLRIDTARKIVCSQTALDAIQYCYKNCRNRNKQQRRRYTKEKMIGRTVMANYGKNLFYKIKDISFQGLQSKKMEDDKLLIEYYEQKYGIVIQNLTQPLLIISEKQNKKCFLVPQLCFMVGLPQQIDETKEKNIMNAIKLQPDQTRSQTLQMIEDLGQSIDQWKSLEKLGVSLSSKQMQQIPYKKIPKPELLLGNSQKVEKGLQTFFNVAGRPIYKGQNTLKCVILYFDRVDINLLYQVLIKNSKNIGLYVQFIKSGMGEMQNNRAPTQIESGIDRACKELKPNLILLIIPNGLKTHYRRFKRLCLVQYKILSQFVCQSTFSHRQCGNIFGKILLQMLVKCRNLVWVPKQTFTLTKSKIILISFQTSKYGMDTIVGTCCTQDENYHAAFSTFGVCCEGKKMQLQLLEVMIKNAIDCLQFYRRKNGVLPDEIVLMSRSGSISVPERKFKQKFLPMIRKELTQFYQGNQLRMAYILILTKDSSKFFIHDNIQTKARNPQIGSVFDQVIVPDNQFFMITQSTSGVSATPIHFKIVDSDSQIPKTVLQQLLFNQCFAYPNYTGVVQVPAIMMSAKKCAQFISQSPFQQKLQAHLQQSPYYL